MESPEVFVLRFFAARNALWRQHQRELEAFQKEFCQGHLIYDKRLAGYAEERILDVVRQGAKAEVTTNGNTKGRYAGRLRYELIPAGDTWFVSDLWIECSLCHGSGKFKCSGASCEVDGKGQAAAPDNCKVCKGRGWISQKEGIKGLLEG